MVSGLLLENAFEDHGVSWLHMREKLSLEMVLYQRCSPGRFPLSAVQADNRRNSVLFLQELAANIVDLPPLSPVFSLQLLDHTHTWSDVDSSDLQAGDIIAVVASIYIHLKSHSVAAFPHEDPFRHDQPPRTPACSLADNHFSASG